MSYLIHYGNLRSGALVATVPATEASWTSELLASGDSKIGLPLNSQGKAVWDSAPAGATLWAVEWAQDGARRIVAAGPVWSKPFTTKSATLAGSGIYSVFAKRRLVPKVATANMPKNDVVFTGLDLGSIIRGIVEHVITDVYGDLPIVLEPARAGSHDRTYLGYESAWSDQRIKELTEVDNGPEFLFQPRFTSDFLGIEWDLLTGTEAEPQLMADTVHVLDATAARQNVVSDVSGEIDASTLATTAWAIGGGTERAQVMRSATDTTLTDEGFPRLEADTTNNSTDGGEVQAYADGLLARNRLPARSLKVVVAADFWYGQGARLGDRVQLIFNHPFIGRLTLTSRVLAEGGNLASPWVTLTLADTLAEAML